MVTRKNEGREDDGEKEDGASDRLGGKPFIDHPSLPCWEAAFLLLGQNFEVAHTNGITEAGMMGMQVKFHFVLQF